MQTVSAGIARHDSLIVSKQRERARRLLLQHWLAHGFESEDELYDYIWEFLGVRIPRQAMCSSHVAPFQIVTDLYFDRVRSGVILASRSSGKTLNSAILNHLDMLFKGRPIEIGTAGATIDQANKGYRYFKDTFRDPVLRPLLTTSTLRRSETVNGSLLEIVVGTVKGLNSKHPNRVKIDEVELIPYPLLEEGLSMAISKDGIAGQTVLMSTRKYAQGTMQRLLREAPSRGLRVWRYCIWDVVERCERACQNDPAHGTCPIWDKCQGRAHDGKGWYKIDDLIEKVRTLTKATFEAQWECKEPHDADTVYGGYWMPDVHVLSWKPDGVHKTFAEVFGEPAVPKDWTLIAGLDFGSRFAYELLAYCQRLDTWVVTDEYFHEGDRLLADHLSRIQAIEQGRLVMRYADTAAKQDRLELRSRGLHTYESIKNVAAGVDEIKQKLRIDPVAGRPKLYVMNTCERLIWEFANWSWTKNPDGTPNYDKPSDFFCDALDALRYAIHTYRRSAGGHRFVTLDWA